MLALKRQLLGTLIFVAIDMIYFKQYLNTTYAPLSKIGKKVKPAPAVIAWSLLVFAIQIFSIGSWWKGALLGLSIYGVYNATNMATIDVWTRKMAIQDTLWGTFMMGLMSIVVEKISDSE